MKSAEESLEFNRIEERLEPYFAFEENASGFKADPMMTSKEELEAEHAYLKETVSFLSSGHSLALVHVHDLKPSFEVLFKGGVLTLPSLASFVAFLEDEGVFISFYKPSSSYGRLNGLFQVLKDFSYVKNRLQSAILPDLTIADDASENLYNIRYKIKKMQSQLGDTLKQASGKYASYLAEVPETIKGGMPVLAVRADQKGHVPGMVQDISNSGGTAFIVPIEVLDIQNKIFILKDEEQQEIEKIIKELTGLLAGCGEDLRSSYMASVRLDSLFARARFGLTYDGCVADNGEEIHLEDLAHPLLNPETLVRNNFSLGGKRAKILVISGPNAGGKTVLIKAVAMAALMNQKGLLADCRGLAVLPVFKDIFFLAGDSQSIMDSLSTFSGHITAIKEGLELISPASLFIVDEIGQGTSPSDGEALGVGVIDYLKKVGCLSILTSHYDGIKQKAFSDPSCLIGAMVFDEKDISPTFIYKEGMIGKSYALEVSSKLGLKAEIIQEAEDYVAQKNKENGREEVEKAIKLQQENQLLQDQLNLKIKEQEDLSQKRERAIEALEKEKQAIYTQAEERVDNLVQEKMAELEMAYKQKKISLKDMAEMKQLVKSLKVVPQGAGKKKKENSDSEPRHVFQVGDRVMVVSMMNSGRLVQFDPVKGSAKVDLGGLELSTKESDLKYLGAEAKPAKKVAVADSYIIQKTGVPLEVNLLGLYQDEARLKLDKYLDDCLLMHFHQVRIIHGNGTGALRTMVQNYLKKNPNVESFRFGGAGEGGVGVTVVTLK